MLRIRNLNCFKDANTGLVMRLREAFKGMPAKNVRASMCVVRQFNRAVWQTMAAPIEIRRDPARL
jgi:hypothetical protein